MLIPRALPGRAAHSENGSPRDERASLAVRRILATRLPHVGEGLFPHRIVSIHKRHPASSSTPRPSLSSRFAHQALGDVRGTGVDVHEMVHKVFPFATPTAHANVCRRLPARAFGNALGSLHRNHGGFLGVRPSQQCRFTPPRSHATAMTRTIHARVRSCRRGGRLSLLPRRCVGHLFRLLPYIPGPSRASRRELRWRRSSDEARRRAKSPPKAWSVPGWWTIHGPSKDRIWTVCGPRNGDPDPLGCRTSAEGGRIPMRIRKW